jgi:hypothetical protein
MRARHTTKPVTTRNNIFIRIFVFTQWSLWKRLTENVKTQDNSKILQIYTTKLWLQKIHDSTISCINKQKTSILNNPINMVRNLMKRVHDVDWPEKFLYSLSPYLRGTRVFQCSTLPIIWPTNHVLCVMKIIPVYHIKRSYRWYLYYTYFMYLIIN